MKHLVLVPLLIAILFPLAHAADNMKAFPPAEDGFKRFVLHVPKVEDEGSRKVEIIVGKTIMTDGVNKHFIGGKIERSVIKGWGFPRYDVKQIGPVGGTLMGVPGGAGAPKVPTFVRIGGEPTIIRYNSRLPIVVYVPNGAEVRYRVWSAGDEAAMDEG